MEDQNAQVTETPTVTSEATPTPEAQQPPAVSPGVQARIDELTAKWREAERQSIEANARIAAMQDQIAAYVTRVPQRQEEAPPPEPNLDPESRKVLDYYLTPLQRQYKAMQEQMQRLQLQTAVQGELSQVEQLATQSKAPPEVIQGAKDWLLKWRNAGIPPQLTTPADALRFAAGEYAQKAWGAPVQPGARQPPPVPAGGSHTSAPPRAQGPLPKDQFEKMSIDDQLAFLEKSGAGDIPW